MDFTTFQAYGFMPGGQAEWDKIVLFAACVFVTITSVALVATWARLGRTWWPIRLAAAGAVVLAPMAIQAPELSELFFFQISSTYVLLSVIRWVQLRRAVRREKSDSVVAGPKPAQYSLKHLFALVTWSAIAFALVISAKTEGEDSWARSAIAAAQGIGVGLFSSLGAWLVMGSMRLRYRLPLSLAWGIFASYILLAAYFAAEQFLARDVHNWLGIVDSSGTIARSVAAIAAAICLWHFVLSALLAFVVCLAVAFAGWTRIRSISPIAQSRTRRVCFALLSLGVMLPAVALYTWLLVRAPIPPAKTENIEAYERLLVLGEKVEGAYPEADAPTEAEWREAAAKMESWMPQARALLAKPIHKGLRYLDSSQQYMDDIQHARSLCRAFQVQGRVAALDGRYQEAAEHYLDAMQFGGYVADGGVMVDYLVGMAVSGIGSNGLRQIRGQFSADECRDVLRRLQEINRSLDTMDNVLAREQAWQDRFNSWQERHCSRLNGLVGGESSESMYGTVSLRSEITIRLLMVELAIRAYQLDHQEYPTDLRFLVPHYLRSVPADPFTNRPLIYRRQDAGYVLYSAGPDRRDHGGCGVPWGKLITGAPGDVLLDALFEEPAAEEL